MKRNDTTMTIATLLSEVKAGRSERSDTDQYGVVGPKIYLWRHK
ncbi:MAG: hypothetical protein OXC80_04580 [Gammaproteobacteria bacterium]|nr:hypothetical protein [Gammaproteobacteria bacterium]